MKQISNAIQEYADSIFKEDAFDSLDRKNEITEYLICFTQDINEEIKNRRNDSAHKKAMSCSDAETCLDYLVLGKKLIFNLINKIKPEFYSDL